ncbi:PREDICTED: uncharacterized protein LOC105559705 [Vollenhovia emeryi]|uniref:uncharacterized protein LOC105559705 n=1 Tax=Vollenhovia emeryi TaxID=411798 RepID=UPI0005F4428C|nr:PREDICTED: uncharacterized protein LOC105559705 [Vollenhovia emeryi]
MEYFIDQRKYFCLILLHINAVIYIGLITMLGIGIMLITYFKHICGMLRIASYRIERAINIDILTNFTLKNKIWMIEGIICAVDTHRQAMKLCLNFLSTFEVMIFMVIGCLVLCFSFNLFQLFQIAVSTNNEFLLPAVYTVISMLYLFITNLVGQSITNNNNHIFDTVYNVQWYRAPLHIQKMLLFLLQRGSKEFTLNVCGVLDASIETFAMVIFSKIFQNSIQ